VQEEAAVAVVTSGIVYEYLVVTCNQLLPFNRIVRCVVLHQLLAVCVIKVGTALTCTVFCCCNAVASQGASYLQSPDVTAAHASELQAAGGIITAQDLAEAVPQERELLKMQVCTGRG
jgi:hypothetical protein